MKKLLTVLAIALIGGIYLAAPTASLAADTDFAIYNPCWWKDNPWGRDDMAGSVNMTGTATIKRALATIKQYKNATIGKPYASDVAFFGPRMWKLFIPGTPTGGPFGKNNLVYHDELVITQIGQVSTQFDGPGHIGVHVNGHNLMYNGRDADENYQRGAGGQVVGMGPMGVEHVAEKGFVCRGVLIDAAGYKGMKMLPIPKTSSSPGAVHWDDVQGALKKQGTAPIQKADCVFVYTGWGDLWGVEPMWGKMSAEERAKNTALFTTGEPGYAPDACDHFGQIMIMMTGGDTSANDAQPMDHGLAVPCHTGLQNRLGIWNLENLDFSKLLADKAYEFAFIWSPIKAVGATGAPGNPNVLY